MFKLKIFSDLIAGLADNNLYEEALSFFKQINMTKDEYTYSIFFKICAEMANNQSLELGQMIFRKMPKNFSNNIVVVSSALQMFIKCGDIIKAEQLFNRIEKKDSFTYSTMMNGKKIYSALAYRYLFSLTVLFQTNKKNEPLNFSFK